MTLSQRRARVIRRLHTRRSRVKEGLVLVEGVRAVREVLAIDAAPRFAVVSETFRRTGEGQALCAELDRRVETHKVEDSTMAELAATERPQGVLLVCAEPSAPLSLAAGGRYLVMDALQDPGNVGTLIRSAVAFGFTAVLCLDGTADPWSAKAVRSSAGLAFRIPIRACELSHFIRDVEGTVPVWVADAAPLARVAKTDAAAQGFALVVGNEGAGVRDELREVAHGARSVRMVKGAESLNAAVAGSILMHELTGPKIDETKAD